jgi:hypothetical protein
VMHTASPYAGTVLGVHRHVREDARDVLEGAVAHALVRVPIHASRHVQRIVVRIAPRHVRCRVL